MALTSYNKFANTNKYPGVRIYISENNDMIFYVRLDGKDIKVGSKSEGVNVTYAYNKKKEYDTKKRNGELPDSITKKQLVKGGLKFDDIAKAFFDYRLEQTPDKTENIKEQICMYEQYHKSKFGSLATSLISSEMIQEHFKNIKETVSSRTGRKLSQSRTNAIMGIIRTIFNYAIKQKLISHLSPFDIEIKNQIINERDF